ncbi:MAG: glycosyltransferase family 4 protein, partial [Deltaproteobacteria bacterium]|nr:glycosyltransferase family 4 protein [Deltaproteobacteria bacterium]
MGKKLNEMGFEIDVFTIRENKGDKKEENFDGINVRRIINSWHYKNSFWGARNYWDIFRFTMALFKKRKELRNFDLLVFNKWPILPPIVLPYFFKNKSVIDWCEIRRSKLWYFIYKLMGNKFSRHTCVNDEIGKYLQSDLKIPEHKIKTILSGIDSELFQKNESKKKDKSILFFGRLSDHKDPEIVIKSFIAGKLCGKGYELNVAGGGALLDILKTKYCDHKSVNIIGPVSDEKKIELLKASTLLVLPSQREGFPRVIAEAAAAGTPTLTTWYPENGSVQVVEQYQVGWVCKPSIEELAKMIETYGTFGNEWREKSLTCIKAANNCFDWNVVCQEFVNFIE